MTAPRFRFVPVRDFEIHVTEWGKPELPALLMLHGLARTGRDFDEIAMALSDRFHVLCPDMIGRGLSGWAADPVTDYCIESYAALTLGLLDAYQIKSAALLGTSMGGQIGMRIASGSQHARLTRLLINDIAPEVPEAAIERILSYVGNPPEFDSFKRGEDWLRSAYTPFGPATDSFWQRMVQTSLRRLPNGHLTLHYDPKITVPFTACADELTSWERWDKIVTPTHVFGGAQSDLLNGNTLTRMLASGPMPAYSPFSDCGHAPTLSRPDDIALVRSVLDQLNG